MTMKLEMIHSTTSKDLEAMDIERERKRDEQDEYTHVERIVDSERVETDDGETKLQYFVKWKRLYYDECLGRCRRNSKDRTRTSNEIPAKIELKDFTQSFRQLSLLSDQGLRSCSNNLFH